MRKNIVELLERRQLLAVITNGLPAGDPAYLAVDVGNGGAFGSVAPGTGGGGVSFGAQPNVMYQYDAFLDLGSSQVGGTGATSSVVPLSTVGGTVSVLSDNSAVSTGRITINDSDNNPANNPFIDFSVTVSLPVGGDRINRTISLSASNFDLRNAKLFEYMDADIFALSDDVLVVRGNVANRSLELSTVDGQTYTWLSQEDGQGNVNASLTGFAADQFPDLRTAILAGGYNAAAAGTINTTNLPFGPQPRIGSGYGPNDITSALQYTLEASNADTVGTSLQIRPSLSEPAMEVYNYASNTLIPDGSVTRSVALGTDFGSFPTVNVFEIRDFGTESLQLLGNPSVVISGPNADSFHVIRQPMSFIGAGNSSLVFIEYLPTQGGTQTADVTIASNDTRTTPYTFRIYGGTGSGVTPDTYEVDGPVPTDATHHAIDTDAPDIWAAEFAQVKTQARAISTEGVGQIHSIHAANDVDWVQFTLENTSNVVIETFAPTGDTRLYLYDADGNRLAYDNDSGPGVSAKIGSEDEFNSRAITLTPGTYYVRVDEMGNNAVIPTYVLYVRAGAAAALGTSPYIDANGTLLVSGTAQDDTISVDVYQSSLRVVRNGNTWYFPMSEVNNVDIRGGWGNDTIYVGRGVMAGSVMGGLGNDVITSDSAAGWYLAGGEGDDSITGGDGNDHINGKAGNDLIYGGAGDDRIQGGFGNDLIYGQDGNDDIFANYGDDTVYGGAGNDSINGYNGDDSLFGEDGNDVIDGGAGRDFISGGNGSDTLISWHDGEVDTVSTDWKNDVLYVDDGSSGVADILS